MAQKETASERFVRLAEMRTNKCLDSIRLIGNLGSAQYTSTPEQRQAVFGAIEDALNAAKAKFEPRAAAERERFTLPQ